MRPVKETKTLELKAVKLNKKKPLVEVETLEDTIVTVRFDLNHKTWCVIDRHNPDSAKVIPITNLPAYLIDVELESQTVEQPKYICGAVAVAKMEVGMATGRLTYTRPAYADTAVEQNLKFNKEDGNWSCGHAVELTKAKVVRLANERFATIYR